MDRTIIDLWVGIFVAAGVVALMVLALKVGNASTINLSESYTIYAEFDNIGGLKVRAPVKSSGVVVGRVAEIQFDPRKYVAKVALRVDRRYEFPADTIASVLTSGLLGEQYVGLDVGGDTVVLKDGHTLKKTQSAVVLEKLIGQFLYGKAAEGGNSK
ncbi:MAG: outer membrane lipid asymmetry maintenance protein MlaD [Betaproteobacteria bacterium]|nr:outer membrane lipid asymmetry maintenance protein MlaD [Betaproteobacteria bacterium]